MIRNLTKNQNVTLKHLVEMGTFTQEGIANELNISVPAANVQFKNFKREGYIIETDQLQQGKAGRPKRLWAIKWDSNFVLSFSFVSGDLLMGLADFQGNIVHRKSVSLLKHEDRTMVQRLMDEFTEKAKITVNAKSGHIRSAYLGIAGNKDGVVDKSVNMPVLEGLNIPDMEASFEEKHGIFCKSFSHLYAFYFGESHFYKEQTMINVIEWDEGIGNVTGSENQIFYISRNDKTECNQGIRDIGHMVIEKDGRKCRCGKNGCMEAYTAGWAIEEQLADSNVHTLDKLIESIQKGNEKALLSLMKAAEILGEQISWLVRYWGVDKIAFTGRMSILLPYFNESFCAGLGKYLPQQTVLSLDPKVNSDNPYERIVLGASHVAKLMFLCNGDRQNNYSDVMFINR